MMASISARATARGKKARIERREASAQSTASRSSSGVMGGWESLLCMVQSSAVMMAAGRVAGACEVEANSR